MPVGAKFFTLNPTMERLGFQNVCSLNLPGYKLATCDCKG